MLASVLLSRLSSSSTDRSALYDSRRPAASHISVRLLDARRKNAASQAVAAALSNAVPSPSLHAATISRYVQVHSYSCTTGQPPDRLHVAMLSQEMPLQQHFTGYGWRGRSHSSPKLMCAWTGVPSVWRAVQGIGDNE